MANIVQKVRDVAKTLVQHPVQSFVAGAKALPNIERKIFRGAVIATGLPSTAISGTATRIVKGGAGLIGKGYGAVSSALRNEIANNPVNVGFTKFGKNLVSGGVTGLALGTSFGLSRMIESGKPITLSGVLRAGSLGLSGGISKLGTIFGIGSAQIEKAKDVIKTPEIPTPTIDYAPPQFNLPNFETPSLNVSMPPANVGGFSSAYNPSISVGSSGMGESMLPLLLALFGGAGLVGYTIGRRRKKKKYKRSKKR